MRSVSRISSILIGLASALTLAAAPYGTAAASVSEHSQDNTATSSQDPTLSGLETLVTNAINNDGITVKAQTLPNHKYLVTLSGTAETQRDADAAFYAAQLVLQNLALSTVSLQNKIAVMPRPPASPTPVRFMWPLTHLLEEDGFGRANMITNLVNALNALYPTKNDVTKLVTAQDDTLWICGSLPQAQAVRAFLALIDAPAPEVRAELWAVQLSGTERQVAQRFQQISADVRATQERILGAQEYLAHILHKHAGDFNNDDLFQALTDVGFNGRIDSALSLVEDLIYLGLSAKRSSLVQELTDNLPPNLRDASWQDYRDENGKRVPYKPFPHLRALLGSDFPTLVNADRESARRFLKDVADYSGFVATLGVYAPPAPITSPAPDPYAPENLAHDSVTMDRLLLHVVQAYEKDMEEMYFLPLLQRVQRNASGSSSGVALAGRVDVVVTSRRKATVSPAVEAYMQRTTVNNLDASLLQQIFGLNRGSVGQSEANNDTAGKIAASTATNSGGSNTDTLSHLIANLTQPQKALVLAALNPPDNSTFHQVAPGISVELTPAVTPDGTTADVVLKANFGVETHINNKNSDDGLAFRPPDAVKSHSVETIFNLSGFNIAQVSSFNLDTLYPRPPFVFPILGQIPLFGPMFRFGRGTGHSFHQSMILMNATIIPRSLQLLGFYGTNPGASKGTLSGKQKTQQYLNQK